MEIEGHFVRDADAVALRTTAELRAPAAAHTHPEPRTTLIVNADDWGKRPAATNRIFDCIRIGAVSSTSAMVFMEDSERSAELAREHTVDAGLHLNLTSKFSAPGVPARLMELQQKIARVLRERRVAQALFHPALASAFEYVVKAQLEEFERLYGAVPNRVDGHHHMHLCANVQWQRLLPKGIMARRNFTFSRGEKGAFNLIYRGVQDRMLAWRHPITDYFFDLAPLDRERLVKVLEIARGANVEVETHPERPAEYEFLMRGDLQRLGFDVTVLRGYRLRSATARMASAPTLEQSSKERPISVATREQPRERLPHISVCICTYKRPMPLKRLLTDLNRQSTGGLFTFSVVVADNDEQRSAEAVVAESASSLEIQVKYCSEPQRGIARARNKVIENAEGDFVALIDDDEFPSQDWLLQLFNARRRYEVDGVLGPVKRFFDEEPPRWLKKSRLYDRPVNPTGIEVAWRSARTGNVLLKRDLFAGDKTPFRTEFKAGEDQDFFRRKIEEGRSFVWSAEAVAHEVLPPARWKRSYFIRKSLLHGAYGALQPDCGAVSIAKSVIAVPVYTIGLPFALLGGQHRFMTLLVKLCDHVGKLLYLMRIDPIREEYVSD